MSDFESVLDDIAQVVGGTRPDSVNKPYWYSGVETGDGTGISGLAGCWSRPEDPTVGPVGVVLVNRGTMHWGTPEERHDSIELLILVERGSIIGQWGVLTPFVDLVPSAFRAKMQVQPAGSVALTGQQAPMQVFPTDYERFVDEWPPGVPWIGLRWTLDFERNIIQTYTA